MDSAVRSSKQEISMNKQHTIEVDFTNPEAAQFVEWLNQQGHTATIGRTADEKIDGMLSASDEETSKVSNALWDAYCNS